MKKTPVIVIIIGCLLLFANVSFAGSAATISRALCKDSRDLVKITIEQSDLDQQLAEDNFSIIPEEGKDVALQQSDESVSEEVEEGETVEKSANQGNFHGHQVTLKIANAGGPYSGQKDSPIAFDGSHCFYVPGSTYVWDFGDDNDRAHGYGLHPTHTYSRDGVYYATLTVTKSSENTYLDIAPVYIGQDNNHLIPLGGCSYEAETGEQINFDASQSMSTDPDAYPLRYRWDFGDGEDYTSWSTDPIITYSYETERVYKVKLEVKDRYGNTRCDILHADIGGSFSDIRNFFINGDSIFDDILSMLFDDWEGGMLFCQWLDVKVYTKYNDIEKYTTIYSFDDAQNKKIDVNNDGIDDVNIGDVKFFKLLSDSPRASPFNNNIESYQFETIFSNIQILSSGDISFNDNFTICLQFTFPPIIADNYDIFGLAEPTVKIGYHMDAGREKPYQQISVTHIFRPFLLAKLGLMNNGNSQQNNAIPSSQQNTMIAQQSAQASVEPLTLTTEIGNVGSTTTMDTSSSMNMQMDGQQQNPMVPLENSGIYPEHGVIIDGITGETISLIGIVENNDYTTTLEIKFESIFTPFVITHRRGDTCRDVDLSGSDTSTVTFSISRENTHGSATLGMLIDPIEYLGFHLDIGRENNERQLTFNIDNPPENVILFTETEDSQGQQDGRYLYMTHIPEMIELRWLPRLDDGYIALDINQGSSDFEVGLCNDLEEPETKLFLSEIPATVDLSWQILLEQPRSIALSSGITGLTLNAELKDVTRPNQFIDFQATAKDDLQITFEWSLPDGYFSLQRSTTTLNFDFFIYQENLLLDVFGNYTAGEGDGLTIDFGNFEGGTIEIDTGKTLDIHIAAENLQSTATLDTDVTFNQEGHAQIEWDEATTFSITSTHSLTFSELDLDALQFDMTADEIQLASSSHFSIQLDDAQLQVGGNNQITLSDISATIGFWSGTLTYAKSVGDFDIIVNPYEKYFEVDSYNKLEMDAFTITYDSTANQYDTTFSLGLLDLQYGGTVWVNFNGTSPELYIHGSNSLDVENLLFTIGSSVDFSLESFHIGGIGTIYTQLDSQQFHVSADVDFDWNLDIQTLNYGDWQINGIFSGNGTMDVAEWQPGQSGQVTFSAISPIYHNLEIIHEDLVIELGNIDLNQGSIAINWQREQLFQNGQFNVTNNGVSGSISLLKLTYNDAQNPISLELGNFTVQPGTFSMDWLRQVTNKKLFHIDNSLTINLAVVKATWGDKTLSIGNLGLTPGEFKFTWDTLNRKVTINNGMAGFGPLCTYEDADRKLSVDLVNLVNDYSKTMTLRWFEDASQKIIGISLDTDDADLVDWIEFGSIKYDPAGATGRRIALGGLRADNFKILKNVDDKLEISGKLYVSNHFIYSRLTDLQNDTWEDFNVEWDFQDAPKMIKFYSDFDPTIKLASAEILGIEFTSEFTLTDYLEVKWELTGGPSEQKEFHMDTNGSTLSSVSFVILGPSGRGVEIIGGGLWADDFFVKWQLWPPDEADVTWSGPGTIGYDTATVYGTVDSGNTWIEVWPFASGSQHT